MKKALSVLLSLSLMLTFMLPAFAAGGTDYTIINPYDCVDWDSFGTYKANLHTHSTASDGDVELSDMAELYYDAGYDILAFTDHGVINPGWTEERETHGIFNGFRKVTPMSAEQYERITSGSDRGGRGMLDITGGIECNMAVVSKTHVNGFFTDWGSGEWGNENDYRTAVEQIEKSGGYSVLNHTGDWVNSNNFPERAHWDAYISYFANIFVDNPSCLGMEIVNSSDNVSRSDRALWDELLQVTIPAGRNIWGFSNDDSEQANEVGRAFELFILEENSVENVKKAMEQGNFFAASKNYNPEKGQGEKFEGSGNVPLVSSISVNQAENTISVECDKARPADRIEWIANGRVISNDFTIDLNDYESELGCYVRFQLFSEGGVTYSQAFELEYEGRADKPIPDSVIPDNGAGEVFSTIYHTLAFALMALIIEKLAGLFGII